MLLRKLINGFQSLAVQYPEWLETNKASLSPEDYQRYEQQAQIMGDICSQFEKEGSEGTGKDAKFEGILDLMQQVGVWGGYWCRCVIFGCGLSK